MQKKHRIHVIKVPTKIKSLFPYSHYNDVHHDPFLSVNSKDGQIELVCEEMFKLKPNVQKAPRNRIDIYIPLEAGVSIATEIEGYTGAGIEAESTTVSPERFRIGEQTLPQIKASKKIDFSNTQVCIAGYTIIQNEGRIFIDSEEPAEGHIEMKGPEIHLGIDLRNCTVEGNKDMEEIIYEDVPEGELRVGNEKNPIEKARGIVKIILSEDDAKKLAHTLKSYSKY